MQHPLYTQQWNAALIRDDPADYVVEHLADADSVLVMDETDFLKRGNKSMERSARTSAQPGSRELPSKWGIAGLRLL